MNQPAAERGTPPAPSHPDSTSTPVVDEAAQQLRAPWAASVAGILFAVLYGVAMVLMRSSPLSTADDQEIVRLFAVGADQSLLVAGLYLVPFAGITFLWFVAVIRDQLGDREDRFFATVFFGSGLLFMAMLFAAGAIASAPAVGVRYLRLDVPAAAEMDVVRSVSYTLLFVFSTRMAAVCLMSIATLGLRSRTFPRWFALTGYLIAAVLLLVVSFFDWVVLLFPAWVAVVSVFILRRERARARSSS